MIQMPILLDVSLFSLNCSLIENTISSGKQNMKFQCNGAQTISNKFTDTEAITWEGSPLDGEDITKMTETYVFTLENIHFQAHALNIPLRGFWVFST